MEFRSGDLTQLGTEAIVNSTNESMTDKNPLTERIFNKAGIGLKNEVRNQIKSKTLQLVLVLSKPFPLHIIPTFSTTGSLLCFRNNCIYVYILCIKD